MIQKTGSWLAIVQGFAQMKTDHDHLGFAPFLPSTWHSYAFHINYRDRLIFVSVNDTTVTLKKISGDTLPIKLYGEDYILEEEVTAAIV